MQDGVLASLVACYVDFAESHGLRRADALAAAHLAPGDLADPDALVPEAALVGLWQLLIARLPDVVIPLAAADAVVARMGILGRLLRFAGSLREALAINERYGRLLDGALRWSVEDRDDDTVFLGLHHRPEIHSFGLPIELMLATCFRVMSRAFDGGVPLVEVSFAHGARYPTEAYREFFGAPVRFGAAADGLLLRREAFDRDGRGSDAELVRYLEAQAQRMLAALPPAGDDFVSRVRAQVARGLVEGDADQAKVAHRLAVSPRTLQRRLAEAGTSFQDVVDEVRRAEAERLLREPHATALDVAFALGYSDAPSFHRAFKRWTGRTPHEFRSGAD